MQWHDEAAGERIDGWIDLMCAIFPGIMYDVVKIGIRDLRYWFGHAADGCQDREWQVAQCGCLVGTAAIAARNQVACLAPVMDVEANRVAENTAAEGFHPKQHYIETFHQSAVYALYMAMVIAAKRDISKYRLPQTIYDVNRMYTHFGYQHDFDPWLVLTARIGQDAGDEVAHGVTEYRDDLLAARNEEVVNYMYERIIANLALQGHIELQRTLRETISTIRKNTGVAINA